MMLSHQKTMSLSVVFERVLLAFLALALTKTNAAIPQINSGIGTITVSSCSAKEYVIPPNSYSDAEDGNLADGKLKLQLLDSRAQLLIPNENNTVQLNGSTLFIVPIYGNGGNKTISLIMRIVDKDGDINSNPFSVKFVEDKRSPQSLVLFEFDVVSTEHDKNLTMVDYYKFYSILSSDTVWNNTQLSLYQIKESHNLLGRSTKISIVECTVSCSVKKILQTINKVKSQNVGLNITTEVQNSMNDVGLTINSFRWELKMKCQFKDEIQIVGGSFRKITNSFTLFQTNVLQIDIPNYVFKYEGISLSDMTLSIGSDGRADEYNIDFWVGTYFKSGSWKIYAVASDQMYSYITNNPGLHTFSRDNITYAKIIIRARYLLDINQMFQGFSYIIRIDNTTKPVNGYHVRFHMNIYSIAREIYPKQIKLFLEKLHIAFGNEYKELIYINRYHIKYFQGTSATGAILEWSVLMGVCNFPRIEHMRSIMFQKGSTTLINEKMKGFMKKEFELVNITETFNGSCKLSPPKQIKSLKKIELSYCGIEIYQIPRDAFYDEEDRSTAKLTFDLYTQDGQTLESSDIIQFHKSTRTIYGLLPNDYTGPSGELSYTLRVTDSSDQHMETFVKVEVLADKQKQTFNVRLSARFTTNENGFQNPGLALGVKVGKYFGDQGKGFHLISTETSANGEKVITFGNCTWSTTVCDVYKLQDYEQKLFTNGGSINPLLRLALQPDFQDIGITTAKKPPCDKDEKPIIDNPMKDIVVSTCSTEQVLVPENTFSDKEQGNTRSLQLSINSIAFSDTKMLEFNSKTQTIIIVASESDDASYNYQLMATDINNNQAATIFTVAVNKQQKQPAFTVSVEFRILRSNLNNYVALYSFIRQKFKTYLGDGDMENTFQILKTNSFSNNFGVDSVHSIEWTNCSLSRDSCPTEEIDILQRKILAGKEIKEELKSLFSADIFFLGITVKNSGICEEENKPPELLSPIPNQNLGYCGPLIYRIPENTFRDNIDGNTSSLNLQLKSESGSSLPDDFYVWLDNDSKTLFGLITEKKNKFSKTSFNLMLTITATNTRGLSKSTQITVSIDANLKQLSSVFSLSFFTNENSVRLNTIMLFSTLSSKLSNFFGWNTSGMYIYDYTKAGIFGRLSFTSCKASYDPCDKELIKNVEDKALSNGQTSEAIIKVIGGFINLNNFMANEIGDICSKNEVPKYREPLDPFTISSCQIFKQRFKHTSFIDEEDATLTYAIVKINGIPVNSETNWINVNSTSHEFFGVVPDDIVDSLKSKTYNLTVRATDKKGAFAEGAVLVTVKSKEISKFYTFETYFSSNVKDTLQIKMKLTEGVNALYDSQPTTSISSFQMNNNMYTVQWRSCLLPTSCLTIQTITSESSKLVNTGNMPTENLVKNLPDFDMKSIRLIGDPVCNGKLNPPEFLRNPLRTTVKICGGFSYSIPEDQFKDTEDGSTRNLTVTLKSNSNQQINEILNWMKYDAKTQTLSGYPSLSQAKGFNKINPNMILTATDITGLASKVDFYITFDLPIDPKYNVTIGFTQKSTISKTKMDLSIEISRKIWDFLNDSSAINIGLNKISSQEFEYFNCSVTFNPCDWAALTQTRKLLASDLGIPTTSFKNSMLPQYDVTYIKVRYELPCSENANNPPFVMTLMKQVTIHMCTLWIQRIPGNTFYDLEDGNTRNLDVDMAIQGSFGNVNWFNYKKLDQEMQIIATAQALKLQPNGGYIFTVTATDKSSLTATTNFQVTLTGPWSILEECKLEMQLTFNSKHGMNVIGISKLVREKMSTYFITEIYEIGIVDIQILSDFKILVFWSYCSAKYRAVEYSSNSNDLKVDYYNFIVKILLQLYQNDRKTIRNEFVVSFGNNIVVEYVKPVFSGRCSNLPPIVYPGSKNIQMTLYYTGYTKYFYENTIFYDFEDGWAYDLYLTLRKENNASIAIDHWINVDTISHHIYAISDNTVRMFTSSSFIYYLHAHDTGGKSTAIKTMVTLQKTSIQLTQFNFTFIFKHEGPQSQVFVNQSAYMINKISIYYSLTSINQVMLLYFTSTTGDLNFRSMIWTVVDHTCNSELLKKVIQMQNENAIKLNSNFVSAFRNLVEMKRVLISSSCVDKTKIVVQYNISIQEIKFCTIYSYQLPENLFYDPNDGRLINLQTNLLNGNGQEVGKSSWLQINSANLMLYGVAIRSIARSQSKSKFQIQARNSAGNMKSLTFDTEIKDQPFTTDCPITMKFAYKYISTETWDIDVLREFINMIKQFYKDKTVLIKILNFARQENAFIVSWSNCSTVFRSTTISQAKYGYEDTVEIRNKINAVFNVIYENKMVKSTFKKFMETMFTIISLTVSYCCIEKAPETNTQEIRKNVYFCTPFHEVIPEGLFVDECDGRTRNLKLSLLLSNGIEVGKNNWVQLDKEKQVIFGTVTEEVKRNAPIRGFRYILKAEDYSGRSAHVTYIINIIGNIQTYDAYFVTGFTNAYDNTVPTATILNETRWKLSESVKAEIYVKEFKYPEVIIWTKCQPIKCSHVGITDTLQKLQIQTYIANPNLAFKDPFSKSMKPYWIQSWIWNTACGSGIITIIVNINVPTNITEKTCGMFKYNIPDSLFSASVPMSSKNFVYALELSNNSPPTKSSMVQLNAARQVIHGYAITMQMRQQYFGVKLNAFHPMSGAKTSANLIFNFPNQTITQKLYNKSCRINTTVTSNYRYAYNDVDILNFFSNTMSSYLKTDGIEILSYSRVDGIRSMWNIIWSDCNTLFTFYQDRNSLTYTRSMKSMISKLIRKENGMTYVKNEFSKWFLKKSQFDIQNITFNKNCEEPPTEPPIPNRPLNDIELPTCGYFEIQIPEDTFKDNQDGNTRNLLLHLYYADGTTIPANEWIFLNSSQFIIGYVNDTVRANMPSNGYNFKLTAQNTAGLTASINIVLKTTALSSTSLPKWNARVRSSSKLDENNLMSWKVKVLKFMIERYTEKIRNPEQINATFDKFIINDDGTIDFTFTFCRCYTISYVKIVFQEAKKLINPFSVITSNDEIPSTSTCGILKPEVGERLYTLEYCSFFSKKFSVLSVATSFSLRDSDNKTLPQNSMAWLNGINLEVFPGDSIWNENKETKLKYTLNSKFSFSDDISIYYITLTIPVIADKPKTLDFSITLSTSTEDSNKMDAFFISLTLNNLRKLFGENLQFSKFERLATDPLKFLVGWKMCINGTSCESNIVKDITEKLITPNFAPSNLAVETFNPYIIEKIETQCDNRPPTSVKSYNITFEECGKFNYKLPISIANDTEDGNFYSLSAEMKMQDQSPITRTSWIQFDDTSKTITAIPTETIYTQLEMQPKTFLLSIKDKGEKITTTSIIIHAEKVEDHLHYYKVNLRFQSNLPSTTTYVDIQLKILEKLKMFTEGELLANVQVIAFEKVESATETYLMSVVDCSIKKTVCVEQNNNITTLANRISNDQGVPTDNVIKSMSPEITLTNAQFLKSYTIDQTPEYTTELQTVEIDSCCQSQKHCFPNETFTDFEDGNLQNLKLTIKNIDGTDIDRSSALIQLIDKCLYVVPSSKTATGTYEYSFSAFDKCKNKKTVTLRIKITKCPESFAHKLSLRLRKKGKVEQLNYKNIDALRQKLTEVLRNEMQLTINEINYQQPYTTITFGICSTKNLKCNFDLIKNISSLIDKENIQSTLKDMNFVLDDITEIKHSDCLVPPPKTRYSKLNYNFTFCELIETAIPNDVFYSEDGLKTRDFQLTFLTNDGNDVEPESWIQFNQTSQTLYGYPRFTFSQQFNRQLNFKIQAKTNGTDKGTTIPLCIYLNGNQPVLDYQLEIEARIFGTYTLPNVFYEIKIIEAIEKMIERGPLNNMGLVKNIRFPYIIDSFRWSFCSARIEPCDCKLINQTTKLFAPDNGLLSLQNNVFAVTKVSKKVDGKCKNTEKPDLVKSVVNYLEIESGKPFKVSIPADSFTDYEDGGMGNLTLCIKNARNQEVKAYDWLKVYNDTICGIFTNNKDFGNALEKTYQYSLVAKDNCGKEESDSFSVKVTGSSQSNSKYCLIINQPYEEFNYNCSRLESVIRVISSIHDRPQSDITVTKIEAKNKNQTTFEWETINNRDINCANDKTSTLFNKDSKGSKYATLLDEMKSIGLTFDDLIIKCISTNPIIDTETHYFWWLIYLLIFIILLLLVLWLLWICIPRYCPGCCKGICFKGCCAKFCGRGGKYSSKDKNIDTRRLTKSFSPSSSDNGFIPKGDLVDGGPPDKTDKIPRGLSSDTSSDITERLSIDSGRFSDNLELPPLYEHKYSLKDTDSHVRITTTKETTKDSDMVSQRDVRRNYDYQSDNISGHKITQYEGNRITDNYNTLKTNSHDHEFISQRNVSLDDNEIRNSDYRLREERSRNENKRIVKIPMIVGKSNRRYRDYSNENKSSHYSHNQRDAVDYGRLERNLEYGYCDVCQGRESRIEKSNGHCNCFDKYNGRPTSEYWVDERNVNGREKLRESNRSTSKHWFDERRAVKNGEELHENNKSMTEYWTDQRRNENSEKLHEHSKSTSKHWADERRAVKNGEELRENNKSMTEYWTDQRRNENSEKLHEHSKSTSGYWADQRRAVKNSEKLQERSESRQNQRNSYVQKIRNNRAIRDDLSVRGYNSRSHKVSVNEEEQENADMVKVTISKSLFDEYLNQNPNIKVKHKRYRRRSFDSQLDGQYFHYGDKSYTMKRSSSARSICDNDCYYANKYSSSEA